MVEKQKKKTFGPFFFEQSFEVNLLSIQARAF